MRLILVRHGETQWNRENRVLGHTEIELNERGRKQAVRVALALREEKVDAIYSSPLKRTRETAEEVARFHQVAVEFDEAFKELDAGELDGLTYEEMMARYSDFLREWIRDASFLRMPGGESLAEVQQRAWQGVEGIISRHPEGLVIVVSHNFVILCIICKALGLHLSQFRRLKLDVASISVLDFGGRGSRLELFNDTCHLENGG